MAAPTFSSGLRRLFTKPSRSRRGPRIIGYRDIGTGMATVIFGFADGTATGHMAARSGAQDAGRTLPADGIGGRAAGLTHTNLIIASDA